MSMRLSFIFATWGCPMPFNHGEEEDEMKRRRLALLSSTLVFAPILITTSLAADVAPIDSTPQGQTYGRWAAHWAQWAFGTPAATNPLLDTTGQFCGQRQVDKV